MLEEISHIVFALLFTQVHRQKQTLALYLTNSFPVRSEIAGSSLKCSREFGPEE